MGEKSKIEFIGSVCTIIFETYKEYGLEKQIDTDLAKLMIAAILDNTLDFKAKITDERDIEAYIKLKGLAKGNSEL